MFVGVGCGAFSAGIYHLMTHAFFKALLFLGAGSVIHALGGEQDMRNMGGLRKQDSRGPSGPCCARRWPLRACRSLPGSSARTPSCWPPRTRYAPWMYWVGVITAGMTAFYVFRALFLTFFGELSRPCHPHESPPVMLAPLVVLAAFRWPAALFNIPEFLAPLFPRPTEVPEDFDPDGRSSGGVRPGRDRAGVADVCVQARAWPIRWPPAFGGLYTLVYNKYFVDEIYDAAVVNPVVDGSRAVLWKGVDVGVIDGTVNGVGARSRGIGGVLRLLQSGNIRSYATWVLLGVGGW